MNLVVLQGNLTHPPQLKYLDIKEKRIPVCSFSIATHRHFRNANGEKNKETTFVNCEAWEKSAEIISKYVNKGDLLLVRGSLKNDSWERDGNKIEKMKIRIDDFNLQPKSAKKNSNSDCLDDTNTVESSENNVQDNVKNGEDIPF